ncbi:MAG: NAD(P)H-hydrate epimerase [Phycisphaerales bacterium]|nr:NAD(P)H-hydrate epimerase [Phycisphaerales bacterium]
MPDSKDQPAQPTYRAQEPPNPPAEHPSPAVYEISVENSRRLDELATTQYGIPSIVLMENAAIGLCDKAVEMLQGTRNQQILIATGPGNNAGDGFALARHLSNRGYEPIVVMATAGEHIAGDAKINLDIITKMNLTMIDAQTYLAESPSSTPGLIIDALLGTGLTRPIAGIAGKLIDHINTYKQTGSLVLAVDVPSGLNAQTGKPIGDSVISADQTVTFAALKEGCRAIEAQPYLGIVTVAPIGIPTMLLQSLATEIHQPRDRA